MTGKEDLRVINKQMTLLEQSNIIENAIQYGQKVLLENFEEKFDPMYDDVELFI